MHFNLCTLVRVFLLSHGISLSAIRFPLWYNYRALLSIAKPQNGPNFYDDCEPGIPVVQCKRDPCLTSVCPGYPEATCRTNLCGKCKAEFLQDNQIVDCSKYCFSSLPSDFSFFCCACTVTFYLDRFSSQVTHQNGSTTVLVMLPLSNVLATRALGKHVDSTHKQDVGQIYAAFVGLSLSLIIKSYIVVCIVYESSIIPLLYMFLFY